MTRGTVHVYQASYTEPDPENPGKRRLVRGSLWYWRFSCNGKAYNGGPGEKTKRAALAHGEKRREQVRGGVEGDPRKVRFPVLAGIIRAEGLHRGGATGASMQSVAKRLETFFGNDLVASIDRARLIEYSTYATKPKAEGGAGRQPSTVNLDFQYLRLAMTLGLEEGKVLRIPRFPKLKVTKRHQSFRPDELATLLKSLPLWWRRFFLAADEMGWRARSEIKTRRWSDVDLTNGWVNLEPEDSKTGKRRKFPVTEYLRAILEAQQADVKAIEQTTGQIIPWVFCRPDGRALGDYRKVWAKACKAAGFGKLEGRTGPWSSSKVAHDLRHTATQRWELAQLPRNASMGMSGHDSPSTFNHYTHATPEALKAAAALLDEHRRKVGELPPKVVSITRTGTGGDEPQT